MPRDTPYVRSHGYDPRGPGADDGVVRDDPRPPASRANVIGPRCESGWTGDRCSLPLHHDGPHSNE